jgi:hypothetical protein
VNAAYDEQLQLLWIDKQGGESRRQRRWREQGSSVVLFFPGFHIRFCIKKGKKKRRGSKGGNRHDGAEQVTSTTAAGYGTLSPNAQDPVQISSTLSPKAQDPVQISSTLSPKAQDQVQISSTLSPKAQDQVQATSTIQKVIAQKLSKGAMLDARENRYWYG